MVVTRNKHKAEIFWSQQVLLFGDCLSQNFNCQYLINWNCSSTYEFDACLSRMAFVSSSVNRSTIHMTLASVCRQPPHTPCYTQIVQHVTFYFVVWPTTSCCGDWSKRDHVTLVTIGCCTLQRVTVQHVHVARATCFHSVTHVARLFP